MGFRFQRRLRLFGGLGLNFSKSGVSWSIRGPGGSIGPKGYSVRTGITGLSYREGFKKKPLKKGTEDNPIISFLTYLTAGGIVLYFLFPELFDLLLIVIGLIVVIILFLFIAQIFKKQKPSTANSSFNSDETIEYPEYIKEIKLRRHTSSASHLSNTDIPNGKKYHTISLDNNIVVFISNMCNEIDEIIEDALTIQPVLAILQEKGVNLKDLVVFDLCKVFSYLDISVNNDRLERDILLVAIGCLKEPPITINLMNRSIVTQNQLIEEIDQVIYKPNPLGNELGKSPFSLLEILRPYPIYYSFKAKLYEFASLITTIDQSLTKNEKQLLEILKNQ